ncbi:hypothetical protein F7725_005515 [Dissostichus mawsoni]|uniref:Fibronectin type-III domain-containing protein n=1 Tax=Dissostichus mawsoni TaxID=36200 RepID=A0A7J5YRY1_DISMA|nr:hypothetical protein F7725_005515 [Dissostichus mawsoni]
MSVPQEGVESRHVRLHWVTGSSGSSPLRLKPFTSYKFRMLATNDVGDSVLSKETEAVTTLQDVPEEPPVILAVKPTTTTSVLVQWKKPNDTSINGVLTGYRLYYRELQVNVSTFVEAEVQATKNNTTSALITTKSTFKTVSSAALTEFELTQLKKFKRYQIVMTSYNIIGESPPSTPVEVSVGEAAPSVAPQSIKVSAVSPSTLEVTWDTPPLETQNGLIQGYKIHYWERDKQNQSEKVKVIFVPDTRVQLSNLTSYTPYLVTLMAFNTAGDGPPSDPRGARTMQSAPSAPSYLSFSEVTGGRVSKLVTVDLRGSWQRWLKVRDLIRGATYAFSVQALTVSYGPPVHANVSAQPVQDEGVWDSFIRLLPPTSRSVSVPLERLRSGISYEFRVIAVNRYGYGQPSTPSAALAALSERPFYEEWWFLLVMALVGIILILVLVFALLLHGHSSKYKACGTGKHTSTAEESVTLDNGGFTALELNSRTINNKNSFLKKNGTRSPPRPSPGGLHYSDEDISTTLTEKPTEVSESERLRRRAAQALLRQPLHERPHLLQLLEAAAQNPEAIGSPFGYEECATADTEPYYQTVVTQHSTGGAYTPTGQPALTHVNPTPTRPRLTHPRDRILLLRLTLETKPAK